MGYLFWQHFFFASTEKEIQINRSKTPEPAQQTAAEPQPTALFVSGEVEAPVWTRKTPAAYRSRIIHPSNSLLTPKPFMKKGDRLELSFFDDVILSSKINSVTEFPNGTIGMTAQMDGAYKGTVYLSYSDHELRVHADVLGGNDFYVRYEPDLQEHVAIEVDRENSGYLNDCETCLTEREEAQAAELEEEDKVAEFSEPTVASDESESDSIEVDIMVVYTPAALIAEGGANGMNNNIALAMLKGNEVHGNSDTKIILNLVHTAETTYTESGSASDDLRILRYTGSTNSAMDEVHTLRDTYAADFVCLLEDEPGTGGIGYVLNSADGRPGSAFSIARVQQSDSGYTVVHEIGHNMGCGHSKTQIFQAGPGDVYDYAAGWQWADANSSASIGYCSVMTYENFNSSGGTEYDRIPYFSNPSINYTGATINATGDATAGDNARAIRNVRYVVADYRIPDVPVTSFPCSNNFEQAYNPWRYYGSDIDWERDRDGTISSSTGPTTGYDGDWYIYVESSTDGEGFPNKEALLQSSFDFSALSSPDISFAYHMYGSSMGSLYLEASTNSGGSWATLWSMTGDQGNQWFATNINLSAYAGSTNTALRFRGVTGSSFRSDMALDTIVVQEVSTDSDNDGMPNEWETLYFGGPTNALPGGNFDGDKFTNLQEYIAGLNPTNSDSFEIYNLNVGASNWFEWVAMTNRLYSVYWTDNLHLNPFTVLQSNLTSGVFTDALHSAETEGFYKLKVQVAP